MDCSGIAAASRAALTVVDEVLPYRADVAAGDCTALRGVLLGIVYAEVRGGQGVAHVHGPVGPGCPVRCLAGVVPGHAYKALEYPQGGFSFPPPRTVGEVAGLYAAGRLGEIRNLGAGRVAEIGRALARAGLV